MAIKSWSIVNQRTGRTVGQPGGTFLVMWELDTGDSGEPFYCPDYPDRSAQAVGSFAGGGHVAMQVSNEGPAATSWAPARDPQGTDITLSADNIHRQFQQNSHAIRPLVSGTIGGVTVYLLLSTTARR